MVWLNGRVQIKKQTNEDHVFLSNGGVQIKETNQCGL